MRKAQGPAQRGLTRYDRVRLQRALQHAEDVLVYRRAQALLLVAEGRTLAEAAHVTGLSRPSVYFWLKRYVAFSLAVIAVPRSDLGQHPD
jgi:winged helix-turn helix protein